MSSKKTKIIEDLSSQYAKRPALVVAAAFCMAIFSTAPMVTADSYQAQINALSATNAQTQNNISALQVKASGYQQVISQLEGKISNLQGLINKNNAEQVQLQQQIQQQQIQLNQEKQVLGADIKAMYVNGQMSTIEELATSKDLSAFVDAETYRNAVQNEVQTTMQKIAQLQTQLQTKEDRVKQLVQDEQNQQAQMSAAQQQQQNLLSMDQSQQASYNAQIQTNNAKIASLQAQQAAAMAARFGGAPGQGSTCGGGYPAQWCEAAQDSEVDSWGMYNRECVSYAAWAMAVKYHHFVPYGMGNANQWPAAAAAYGIPEGSTPRVGSVAIWYVGSYGHAMVVDAVYPDGSFLVSQYNYSFNGTFSTMVVGANSGFTFIYF